MTSRRLAIILDIHREYALKQYRYHRGRREGIYDTARFAAALYARAEWNALHRLVELERAK